MFWTAFIWGLGATCGGSIGMMAFIMLVSLWKWLTETKAAKRSSEVAELMLAALDRRNELTNEQLVLLGRIAVAMEQRDVGVESVNGSVGE